ncbi:zinc-ribbon domain-containing protein [Cognatishimia sp. MH4019]|uniref:zinc-ribbon domain-containing protein n=1 Tax=Cognatishimia sp. MH4019 TaxID=2854030 RepID=UPI001CD5F3D0|nr:zinc-ribbon domain-containing protein [Cognatishimia sp. MH4019]
MRLICPNCGAQYEIGDDAIPEDGRDVQCSNCGHTWFQTSAKTPVEDETDEDPIPEEVDLSPPADEDELTDGDLDDAPEPQREPTRRPLPEDVQAVLQEEAAYEETARKAEAEALEYQQDLGLSGAMEESPRDVQARERMARLRGLDPEDPESAPEPPAEPTRKELLPDIEEINSTLRGGLEHASVPLSDAVEEPVNEGRRGFRIGFGLALMIAAALTLTYVYAPQISAAMPGLADMLTSYVAQVDQLRISIDNQLKIAVDTMNGGEG